MSMRSGDRILYQPSRGDADTAIAWARANGAQRMDAVMALIREYYKSAFIAGIDASILVAQAVHETNAFQSSWWVGRLNPAGIGITGDPAQNDASHTWTTGTDAADSHIAHLGLYASGVSAATWFDPRADAYPAPYGNTPQARTLALLAGTWATDPDYAAGVCARGNAVFPDLEDQPVSTFATPIPGLPGGNLVTDYPIDTHTFMLPSSNTYQRPGIAAQTPRRSVQHGTGNPNSLARDDASWVHGGADGNQESMHFECDDTQCFQLVPVNEVTWQAADGNGPGNMCGVSCEMTENAAVWNDPARRGRAIHIAADLLGRISARLGIHTGAERHWDFNAADPNRHHCPDRLMSTGLWDAAYVPQWNAARIDELRRMGGQTTTTTTPAPVATTTTTTTPSPYPQPRTPPAWTGKDADAYGEHWLAIRRPVRAIGDAPRLQLFDTHGPVVGPPIPKGTRFEAWWYVRTANGNFVVTENGTVVGTGNIAPKVLVKDGAKR